MLTEQEATAQLNEKISNKSIKPTTNRFLEKIKVLQDKLAACDAEIKKIETQKKSLEKDVDRIKGAISILLELAAEDEGMLEDVTNDQ